MVPAHKLRRSSRQKKLILETILDSENHPTAGDIYAILSDSGIGIATIYRQLANLVNDGTINSFQHQGETRYEPVTSAHAHITCPECGRIWDVELPQEIANLAPASALFDNFEVNLTWVGTCKECR